MDNDIPTIAIDSQNNSKNLKIEITTVKTKKN